MKRIVKSRKFRYLAAFITMVVVLLSMTIQPMLTKSMGTEILIKTKPLDPTDVFRGDYVRLNYEINEIPDEKLDEDILEYKSTKDEYNPYEDLRGKNIYVTLKKNGNYYELDKATLKKPKEGIYLKAKYYHSLFLQEVTNKPSGIVVNYRLDNYFVPENTGKELEEKASKGEILAKIKVYKGYGLLTELVTQ
ncbi:hypothetical protein CLHOM_27560 [Clostridium homopropionicum DSM 5847]|uniref:GDYXXLXY protein n=1 Tax=Clostridium homopropionicum DSM 5847 TaxID=1121318 RepID=A0A0L6Z778_9CLOT|nr:GDYXXLXY domain-containing protein [Clostridium homopropionicum]KOA18817.1 hypothetical protein CLHOM_27560 [Clostridium homopropionicum DSM 5847]SFG89481.1 Uncharacterized membrane-anchored protein [Clostridium homopropionicum]